MFRDSMLFTRSSQGFRSLLPYHNRAGKNSDRQTKKEKSTEKECTKAERIDSTAAL